MKIQYTLVSLHVNNHIKILITSAGAQYRCCTQYISMHTIMVVIINLVVDQCHISHKQVEVLYYILKKKKLRILHDIHITYTHSYNVF